MIPKNAYLVFISLSMKKSINEFKWFNEKKIGGQSQITPDSKEEEG